MAMTLTGPSYCKTHPSYNSWRAMKARCLNPNNIGWDDYGGRGITVCDRWRLSFWDFVSDMGERPAGYTLERMDGDKGYEPGNCRWATRSEQNHNLQKKRKKSKFKGVTQVREGGRWRAKVGQAVIGWFETELEAAIAYDREAVKRFGIYAQTNFVMA